MRAQRVKRNLPVKPERAASPFDAGTVGSAIAGAADLCERRGVQLTSLRRKLLEMLWEHPELPTGAYALMRRLEASLGKPVTATTVYRSLDFLLHQGLVMRIESRNAYLPCPRPGRPDGNIFFVCDVCGAVTSSAAPSLDRLLARQAAGLGFSIKRRTLELQGICLRCSDR